MSFCFTSSSRVVSLRCIVRIALSTILVAVAAHPAPAQCADYDSHLHWINTVTTPGHPYRVAIEEKIAYVASSEGGLSILDIGDPAMMTVTSTIPDLYASDVDAEGSYAYVADWGVGLRVVDVQDTANPVIVGTCDLANIASVTVAGGYAYVTEPALATFHVVDISNPTQPVIVGSSGMPDFAWDTAIQGDFAYVACSYAGIAVVDIREPKDPQIIELANTPGVAYAVTTNSACAYVADGDSGLTILKISDPYHVAVIGNLVTTQTHAVELSGSYAVVTSISEYVALLVIDVSDPVAPALVGWNRAYYRADGLAVDGSLALVADGSKLIAFDLAEEPEAISRIGGIDGGASLVMGVDARGGYAYIGRNSGGIQVADVVDPATPTVVGICAASGSSRAVALSEEGQQVAVAAGGAGLHLFTVTDPAHPARLGGVDTPGYAWDVVRSGEYAYIADGQSGVQIVQISNPAAPVRIGSLNLPGSGLCKHVALSGDYLYATDNLAGLFVVDITDPSLPTLARSVPIPNGGLGVAISGDYAYVTRGEETVPLGSLWVVDISDPISAFLVGGVPLPAVGRDLTVDSGFLYICADPWGVYVYSIEDPVAPQIVGGVDLMGFPEGIVVSDDLVYVVNQVAFAILPAQCPFPVGVPEASWSGGAGARILSTMPNPTRGEMVIRLDLPIASVPDLAILDVAGRCVRRIASGGIRRGQLQVTWDGRDDAGRPVPSGSYFVRFVGERHTAVEKLVVLR